MSGFTREKRFRTRSENGTLALGETIAEILVPVKMAVLRGELGAGKTTLVKGIAQALGAAQPEDVTSPTFTLVHEYVGRRKLYHLDLYRLETEREIESLGIEEMASEPGALVLVEWGERFPSIVARAEAEIAIGYGDEVREFLVRWRE